MSTDPLAVGTFVLVRMRGIVCPASVAGATGDGGYVVTPLGGHRACRVEADDVLPATFPPPETAEDVLRIIASAMNHSAHKQPTTEVRDAWHAAARELTAIVDTYPRAFDRAISGDDSNRRITVNATTVGELADAPRHRRWMDLHGEDMAQIDPDAVIAEAPPLPWFFDIDPDDRDAINGSWTGKFYYSLPGDDCGAVYMYQDGPETLAAIRFVETAAWHWPRDRRLAHVARAAAKVDVDPARCPDCDDSACGLAAARSVFHAGVASPEWTDEQHAIARDRIDHEYRACQKRPQTAWRQKYLDLIAELRTATR